LYGGTPFYSTDRHNTSAQILVRHDLQRPQVYQIILTTVQRHRQHLSFPRTQIGGSRKSLSPVTEAAINLIQCLLMDREKRLSCRAYRDNDIQHRKRSGRPLCYQTSSAYFVSANDAEDIKAHHFFHGINWETIHQSCPPWMPRDKEGQDIAMNFENEDQTLSASQVSSSSLDETASLTNKPTPSASASPADIPIHTSGQRVVVAKQSLYKIGTSSSHCNHDPSARKPFNFLTNTKPSSPSSLSTQVDTVPNLPCKKGRKEKKLPNNKILRDPAVARTALEVRKRAAFLGYTYRRCELPDLSK